MRKCDDFHESIDYGHGRIEERKCGIIRDLNSILNKDCWKNLHSFVRLESKRIFKKTGRTQQETRYYISSLSSAETISKSVRSHWGIENKVHWTLNMVYGEDSSSKRTGFSAQNFSTINKIAQNTIRKDKDEKRFAHKIGMNSKQLMAGWNDDYLMDLLNLL